MCTVRALKMHGGGPAVKPGKATDSLFLHRVTGEIEPRMPMGRVLPEADVALLQNWIDEGARPSPDAAPAASVWEPMLSLDAPAVPGVVWEGWEVPADRFTAAMIRSIGYWERAAGLNEPASSASASA